MKKKILIISGGISKERKISLETGNQVAKELIQNNFDVKICEPNFQIFKVLKKFKPNVFLMHYMVNLEKTDIYNQY